MYDPWELIGRYALTGIILDGLSVLLMIIRLLFKMFTSKCGPWTVLNKFQDEADKIVKAKWYIKLIRIIVWPYGVVHGVCTYMRAENKVMDEIAKTE